MDLIEAWKIEKVEEMPIEEQKKFYEKLINIYKKEIKKLKDAKKEADKIVIKGNTLIIAMYIAAIGITANNIMKFFGINLEIWGVIEPISEMLLVDSVLLTSLTAKKKDEEVSEDAKWKIRNLKAKIKELETRIVMLRGK